MWTWEVSQGSIIDLTLEMAVQNDEGATAVTGAVVGATTGFVYVRALDSDQGTATVVPMGVETI
jgi:hypothetical protein